MTIEIHQPELEALIQERVASGNFASVEEFLRQTLDPIHLGATQGKGAASPNVNGRKLTLDEVFGLVRGLADDVDFSRDRSLSRPLDLEPVMNFMPASLLESTSVIDATGPKKPGRPSKPPQPHPSRDLQGKTYNLRDTLASEHDQSS